MTDVEQKVIVEPGAPGFGFEVPAPSRWRGPKAPISVYISGFILAIAMLCALLPGLVAPQSASQLNPAEILQYPSGGHLLGTDQLGRDVLSQVIAGTRTAVLGPLLVAIVGASAGTLIGLFVGYVGGVADSIVGRVVDFLFALPHLIVVILLVGVFGGGYWLGLAVLTVFGIPGIVRLVRAATIERRNLPYVEAAWSMGLPRRRIMFSHLLPNVRPVAVTCFFLALTYGIIAVAALSFFGLGVPPGSPDWGRMIAENRAQVLVNPWPTVAPCLALVLSILSVNAFGGWIYERLEQKQRLR